MAKKIKPFKQKSVGLPTLKSTGAGAQQLTKSIVSPAIAPLQGVASSLAHPLQTLNAPPIVTAAASAIGTMFGGDDGENGAGKALKGAGTSLNKAGTSLNAAAATLNQDVIPNILRDVRDSIFAIEIGVEKTQEWLGKIFRQGEASGKSPGAPQGQMKKGGKFAGFRKKSEDAGEKLKAIEKEREEGREEGDEGEGEAEAEAEKKSSMLSGIFNKIPGFKMISGLFGSAGGLLKVFSKLLWPLTIILGVFSFVDGFMKGNEEGGILEGIIQGLEQLVENLIDVPLNMLKDLVSWIAGALGFEEVEKVLDSFEFDFSGLMRPMIDFFVELWETIKAIPTKIKEYIIDSVKAIPGASWLIGKITGDAAPAPNAGANTKGSPLTEGGPVKAAKTRKGSGPPATAPAGSPAAAPAAPAGGEAAAAPASGGFWGSLFGGGGDEAATPTATASVTIAPGEGATSDTPGATAAGAGLGSTGTLLSDMAGDLGVAVLGGGFGVQKISEHPRFGGYSATHKSAAHREHRAIDIGTGASAGTKWNAAENRYDYESIQNPIRAYMERWAAARGAKLKIIGGDWPGSKDLARQHQDHLHVEIASAPKAGAEIGGPGPGIRIPETGGRDLGPPTSPGSGAPVIINAGGGSSTNITNSSSTAQISAPASPRGPGLPTLSSIEHHSGSSGYQPT